MALSCGRSGLTSTSLPHQYQADLQVVHKKCTLKIGVFPSLPYFWCLFEYANFMDSRLCFGIFGLLLFSPLGSSGSHGSAQRSSAQRSRIQNEGASFVQSKRSKKGKKDTDILLSFFEAVNLHVEVVNFHWSCQFAADFCFFCNTPGWFGWTGGEAYMASETCATCPWRTEAAA